MQRSRANNGRLTESQKIAAETAKAQIRTHFSRFFNYRGQHVLQSAKTMSGGMTNHNYLVRTNSNEYIARVPGSGSAALINRKHESYDTQVAFDAGLTPEVVYDEVNGKKVTRFLKNANKLSINALRRTENMVQVAEVLKKLHAAKPFTNTVNIFNRNREWLKILHDKKFELPEELLLASPAINKIENELAEYDLPCVPCHIDTTPGNFVWSEGKLYLIDFEYSGNNDPVWDLAYLSMEGDFTSSQSSFLLHTYFGDALTDEIKRRFTLYQPVAAYHIAVWSMVQLANKNMVGGEDELQSAVEDNLKTCMELLSGNAFKEPAANVTPIPEAVQPAAQEAENQPRPTLFKRVKTVLSLPIDAMRHSNKTI